MRRIKKFESFTSHRMPEKATHEEWDKKLSVFGEEEFTQKEIDFFRNISESSSIPGSCKIRYNIGTIPTPGYISIEDYKRKDNSKGINLEIIKVRDKITVIQFNKLSDDWYLIYDYVHFSMKSEEEDVVNWYICDEWEEVLGYLSSKNLNLPL